MKYILYLYNIIIYIINSYLYISLRTALLRQTPVDPRKRPGKSNQQTLDCPSPVEFGMVLLNIDNMLVSVLFS